MFNFCPKCRHKLEEDKANHFTCANCSFNFYTNPNPAVAVILINKKNQIALVKRAREPKNGYWDLPGGFIKFGETAEEAARREAKEETGMDLKDIKYLCSHTAEYYYKGTQYYPLDLYFIARVDQDDFEYADKSELSAGKFFDLKNLPVDILAFDSAKAVLKKIINNLYLLNRVFYA